MSPQPIPHGGGWGAQSWGSSGWGGQSFSPGGAFTFLGALCPSENIVRLLFSQTPYYSSIFDTYDASDPVHYSVTPVPGSVGYDGYSSRSVTPVQALISTAQPNAIDVYLDRPMSPYPAQYAVSFTELATGGLSSVLANGAATIYGVYRRLTPQHEDAVLATSDLANPQTASSILDSGLGTPLGPGATLGVLQVDDSGDYAFETGVQTVKKRIFRRGLADKGAFAHLPRGYGVGLMSACKKLGSPSVSAKYAADYQAQILQEPEVVAATVTAIQDPSTPAIVHFVILVKTNIGTTLSFDHPMNVVQGISLAQLST